jgi:hypothetical protein
MSRRIDFAYVNTVAARNADAIVRRWLPDGRREGAEHVARNPTRDDQKPGSFKVNLNTGRWADFSTGDRGGDLVSLAAFLFRLNQADAAKNVAEMLGIDPYQ